MHVSKTALIYYKQEKYKQYNFSKILSILHNLAILIQCGISANSWTNPLQIEHYSLKVALHRSSLIAAKQWPG